VRAPIQTELGYKSNVRNEVSVNTESGFMTENLLTNTINKKSSDDDDTEAATIGPTSCALGPNSFEILDGQHLCHDRRFSSATIYAPIITNKEQQLLPSVVMIGGWGCGESVLASWGPFLASYGIVAMTIGAPSPFEDMPQDRCLSLLDAVKALQTENDRQGSKLEGRLDGSKKGVMGLSLGGAGAQLAALEDPTLSCVVALVPHDGIGPPLNPTNVPPFPKELTTKVPTLIVCGEQDDIADPQNHAWPMYDKCKSSEKIILEVTGGDHGIAHGPAGWSASEDTLLQGFRRNCSVIYTLLNWYGLKKSIPFEGMTNEGQARESSPNGAIGGVTLAWLKWCLLEDATARSQLLRKPKIASGYATSIVEKMEEKNSKVPVMTQLS